jgi:phosphoglycerate dehydrogenase-like enzyme
MLSAERLRLMQTHAWLVNVARGTLVDTEALVTALRQGRLGGAALDVTDPEPLPNNHPLWTLPNAIVTSHTANTKRLGAELFAARVRENVTRFRNGRRLLGAIDAEHGY